MFNQYAKGYVKEHSVGMRYVKLELAVNSDSKYEQEEKAIWDKYIDEIVNKVQIEEQSYWAVSEAKAIEGSAVVRVKLCYPQYQLKPLKTLQAKKKTSRQ
jgi:hypothetical protein